jgi:hypothetical protein
MVIQNWYPGRISQYVLRGLSRIEFTRNNSTADSLGRDLGHVEDDDSRHEADANTRNQATRHKQRDRSRSNLKNDANREDTAAKDDSCAPTNPVREGASKQRAEERASRQNRHNQRLLPSLVQTTMERVGSIRRACGVSVNIHLRTRSNKLTSKFLLEIVHRKNAIDVAGVVTE